MSLDLEQTDRDGIPVVRLSGNIGTEEAAQAETRLAEIAGGDGVGSIILDLSGVDYMNSDGLGVMVKLMREVRERGGSLALAAPGPFVMDVLETTKLTEVFNVTDSVDKAVADLK